jgi:aryl-alcohol dehydrogenase-like predicted oxidoreductase
MKYTSLERTDLQVSRLCLGTMNFGPQTSEAESAASMDAASPETLKRLAEIWPDPGGEAPNAYA